ncbi:A/G-specific adenine glycosylase [Comamonas humi]
MSEFSDQVVQWQSEHGRHHLPWQNTTDPYRVWLSEIMLQQTQVTTVLGYYQRFLERFPTVKDLAEAGDEDVMALWAGLGYYSRARNLHRCAQDVMERFGGAFPRTAAELATLPGIGRSTAAAISSFCFGERAAILDANVKRVLTRAFAFDDDLAKSASEKKLWALAESLLPQKQRAQNMPRYTQGLMDLGASVCTSRSPSCLLCPVQHGCRARQLGTPERFPVKTRTLKRSAQQWWLLLLRRPDGAVWLEKRPAPGIWAGLHCLPVFESEAALQAALPPLDATVQAHLPAFLHVLTHRDLYLHPVGAQAGAGATPPGQGLWCAEQDWADVGLPAPIRSLLLGLSKK